MLSPLPRHSDWRYCFAHSPQSCQPSLIWPSGRPVHRPFRGLLSVHSRYGLHTRAVTVYRDTLSEGFSHFVTSMTAPVASGWSDCRVGVAPTGKRRLSTAHGRSRHDESRVASSSERRSPGPSLQRDVSHVRPQYSSPTARQRGAPMRSAAGTATSAAQAVRSARLQRYPH